MDFLSAVTLGVTGNADCLVLNSVANVEKAAGLLDGYGRIGCFLDRDEAGRRTTAWNRIWNWRFILHGQPAEVWCRKKSEDNTMKKVRNKHLYPLDKRKFVLYS